MKTLATFRSRTVLSFFRISAETTCPGNYWFIVKICSVMSYWNIGGKTKVQRRELSWLLEWFKQSYVQILGPAPNQWVTNTWHFKCWWINTVLNSIRYCLLKFKYQLISFSDNKLKIKSLDPECYGETPVYRRRTKIKSSSSGANALCLVNGLFGCEWFLEHNWQIVFFKLNKDKFSKQSCICEADYISN